jgi:hypothetical protein
MPIARLDIGRVFRTTLRTLRQNALPLLGLFFLVWSVPNFALHDLVNKAIQAWANSLAPIGSVDVQLHDPFRDPLGPLKNSTLASSVTLLTSSVPAAFARTAAFIWLWRRLTAEALDIPAIAIRTLTRTPVVYLAIVGRLFLVFFGFVLIVAPAVWITVVTAVLVPVIAVENPRNAVKRAWALVDGSGWRVLVVLILLFGAQFAFSAGSTWVQKELRGGSLLDPAVWRAIFWTLQIIPNTVVTCGVAALYYELRLLKEGVGNVSDVFG